MTIQELQGVLDGIIDGFEVASVHNTKICLVDFDGDVEEVMTWKLEYTEIPTMKAGKQVDTTKCLRFILEL